MRTLVLAVLLLAPVASAQMPAPQMEVQYVEVPEGALENDTYELVMEVAVSCPPLFSADLGERRTLHIAHSSSANVHATSADVHELPDSLCTTAFPGSTYVASFDVAMKLNRTGPSADSEAVLETTVSMSSSDPVLAPTAPDASHQIAWVVINDVVVDPKTDPPIPQEQTTPGPALPLMLAGILALAFRRRD